MDRIVAPRGDNVFKQEWAICCMRMETQYIYIIYLYKAWSLGSLGLWRLLLLWCRVWEAPLGNQASTACGAGWSPSRQPSGPAEEPIVWFNIERWRELLLGFFAFFYRKFCV